MPDVLENYNLKDIGVDVEPTNRTLKLANAIACAKELYEIGDMSEEAYKSMSLHCIELAGYERIAKDF